MKFMMNAELLLILLAFGCTQDAFEVKSKIDICSEEVSITDIQTQFSAKIDDENWVPNDKVSIEYYGNKLFINASDLTVTSGMWRSINLQIDSPFVGKNDVSYSNQHKLSLRQINNKNGFTAFATCGYVYLTKLDTIAGHVSGYFQGLISGPDINSDIMITDGVFNNLEFVSPFCEPSFLKEAIQVDLYNDWQLTGIFKANGDVLTFPICNSITKLTFLDTNRLSGEIGNTTYWAGFTVLSNNELTIEVIGSYRDGGTDLDFYYQDLYFDQFNKSQLNYFIDGNSLTLMNINTNRELKFILLK